VFAREGEFVGKYDRICILTRSGALNSNLLNLQHTARHMAQDNQKALSHASALSRDQPTPTPLLRAFEQVMAERQGHQQ
jgi:galactokinase